MPVESFRFDPPEIAPTPTLRWVLARAYAPAEAELSETEGGAAVELAQHLALAARIAARHPIERLAGELGPPAVAELKRHRALVVAQEMRLAAALAAVDEAAAEMRVPYAPLKGQALVLGGFAPDGGRPAGDLDILVPEARLEALQLELRRRGFVVAGAAYEHQAPTLRHRDGAQVELHRVLPGVRLEPKRSATFDLLVEAGWIGPASSTVSFRPKGDLRLPRRELLTAHALVHAIAQHGLSPATFPGFLFFADLVDLAFRGSGGRATLATIAPWIEREVSFVEASAALDLATALATGDGALFDPPRSPERRLLEHFYAGAVQPEYAAALKLRLLERPLSDKPPVLAKAELLARTLAPRPGESLASRLSALRKRWFDARSAAKKR